MLPAENIYICIKHLYFSEIQISNTVVATCCKEEGVGKGGKRWGGGVEWVGTAFQSAENLPVGAGKGKSLELGSGPLGSRDPSLRDECSWVSEGGDLVRTQVPTSTPC